MAYVGAVRLSPWMRPYYRDHMHRVRRTKDLLLLVNTLSAFFHNSALTSWLSQRKALLTLSK
eukprot:13652374-Heterocapsa_arctica.AAC.1